MCSLHTTKGIHLCNKRRDCSINLRNVTLQRKDCIAYCLQSIPTRYVRFLRLCTLRTLTHRWIPKNATNSFPNPTLLLILLHILMFHDLMIYGTFSKSLSKFLPTVVKKLGNFRLPQLSVEKQI